MGVAMAPLDGQATIARQGAKIAHVGNRSLVHLLSSMVPKY